MKAQFVNQDAVSMFPRRLPNGDVILNEKCGCNHFRTQHNNRFTAGHGKCEIRGCDCAQFTWIAHVMAANNITGRS